MVVYNSRYEEIMYLTEYERDTSGNIVLKINARSTLPKEEVETFYLRPSPQGQAIAKYSLTEMLFEQSVQNYYALGSNVPVYIPQVVTITLRGVQVPLDSGDELVFTCQKI